jgi:hypothetical protein
MLAQLLIFYEFIFIAVLGMELRTLHMLSKHITSAPPPAQFVHHKHSDKFVVTAQYGSNLHLAGS